MRAGKPGAMRRVLTAVLLLTTLHVTAPLSQGLPVAAAVPPGSLGWPAAPPSPSPECMSPLALDGGDGPGLNGARLAGFGWTAPDEWQLPPALGCAEPDAADGVAVGPAVWAGDGRGDADGPAADYLDDGELTEEELEEIREELRDTHRAEREAAETSNA